MKNGRVLIGVVLLVALIIVGVQLWHHAYLSGRLSKQHRNITDYSRPGFPKDKAGIVTVFGHEYSETQVQTWFSKVSGRYCYCDGIIYAVGTAPGKDITYEQFVCALKQGYYFPELGGEGVKSDGKKVILQHEGLSHKKKPGGNAVSKILW